MKLSTRENLGRIVACEVWLLTGVGTAGGALRGPPMAMRCWATSSTRRASRTSTTSTRTRPRAASCAWCRNLRLSTFDKFNPFTHQGHARRPTWAALMFESLLTGALDESRPPAYGLLAEDVEVAPDGLSATFRLRPEARFHDGDAGAGRRREAHLRHADRAAAPRPQLQARIWRTWRACDVLDERTVRFASSSPNRELPLMVGGMPVFSRKWGMENGKAKPFDQVVMDIPIGSGPYKIGPVRFGKDITYVRDPNYWARDLHVRRGSSNFDRITVKIYLDNTARLRRPEGRRVRPDARFFSAGDWARRVQRQALRHAASWSRGEFEHRSRRRLPELRAQPRNAKFKDIARARGARPGDRLRVDEPADVLRLVPAGGGPVRQHRLPGRRACPGRRNWRCWSRWRGKLPAGGVRPDVPSRRAPTPPSQPARATCARRATC